MKILLHGGVTRIVVLTSKYAIKLPTVMYGWKMFLYGMLGNMNERTWSGQKGLCPVLWSVLWGFCNIMPRCEALTDDEFARLVPEHWGKGCALPEVEIKTCSFGRLQGKIVAIDYGGFGWEADKCQKCGYLTWKGR